MRNTKRVFMAVLALILVCSAAAFGQKDKKAAKELNKAIDRVNDASAVINEIMKIKEQSIPRDLLNKAEAVVVFPGTIKAAFIVGGQGGHGVAIRRVGNGWSAPAFINMAGGSVGFQIGGQKTDYVLLVMNDKGLSSLLKDKFEIGGEGSVAAGPIGRTAAASTDATLDAEILSYSHSKGAFAGVSLKGVTITQDKDMNQAIYNKNAPEIIGKPPVGSGAAPSSLRKLGRTLSTYSK